MITGRTDESLQDVVILENVKVNRRKNFTYNLCIVINFGAQNSLNLTADSWN